MVGTARSIEITKVSYHGGSSPEYSLMYSYATRGLRFLVRCATISRQLGQGRQRSGGSPLFMLNTDMPSDSINGPTGLFMLS